MKKTTKIFSVVALCIIMVTLSIVPTFAASQIEIASTSTVYVENQSFMNCYNRYIDSKGKFIFNIRVTSGYINAITYSVYDSLDHLVDNYNFGSLRNNFLVTDIKYNDNGYDYFTLIMDYTYPGAAKANFYGMGVRLFYDGYYNGQHIMATNTSNGSTVVGQGYHLSR